MALYSYQKDFQRNNYFSLSVNPLKLFSFIATSLGFLSLAYLAFNFSLIYQKSTPLSLIASKNTVSEPVKGMVLGAKGEGKEVIDRFYVSIPKLGIEKARVITNVESDKKDIYFPILNYALAHYKGTVYPGEEGDSFIYGHSVLPLFYNNKDYLSIFSKLHELQSGDEVEVFWGEKKFVYMVFDSEIVSPENLDAINFSKVGEKTLTLMTCNPPGTFFKRLLVKTRLISLNSEPF